MLNKTEQRAEKKRVVEEGIAALTFPQLVGRPAVFVTTEKENLTKVRIVGRLNPTSRGQEGGPITPV